MDSHPKIYTSHPKIHSHPNIYTKIYTIYTSHILEVCQGLTLRWVSPFLFYFTWKTLSCDSSGAGGGSDVFKKHCMKGWCKMGLSIRGSAWWRCLILSNPKYTSHASCPAVMGWCCRSTTQPTHVKQRGLLFGNASLFWKFIFKLIIFTLIN